jgi:hypothetical protein
MPKLTRFLELKEGDLYAVDSEGHLRVSPSGRAGPYNPFFRSVEVNVNINSRFEILGLMHWANKDNSTWARYTPPTIEANK